MKTKTKKVRRLTLAACGRDLGEGVVTAVTLASYDPALAGALPRVGVAGSRLGAQRETLAGVAGVIALGAVIVVLHRGRMVLGGRREREREREKYVWGVMRGKRDKETTENCQFAAHLKSRGERVKVSIQQCRNITMLQVKVRNSKCTIE